MADRAEQKITQEALDAFAEKLQAWAADLPPEQKAILAMILNRAGEEPDVAGFEFTREQQAASQARLSNIGQSLSPSQRAGGWAQVWARTQ